MKNILIVVLGWLLAVSAWSQSGTCGSNLTWELKNGMLTISGTGSMEDSTTYAPWHSYRSSIQAVIISDGVTSIKNTAFYDCSNLVSVTIPNSVESIGVWAFAQSSSLTAIAIPNSVTSIGYMAFDGCANLVSVTIPDSLASIANGTFYGCSSLASIIIPKSVTSIDGFAFTLCSSLTSITIPGSVESIGDCAFEGCSGLVEIISLNPTPPALGVYVFQDVNTASCALKVPAGSKSSYQAANQWCDFLTIVEDATLSLSSLSGEEASFVLTESGVQITGCDPQERVSVYTLTGREVYRTVVGDGFVNCSLRKGETYIVRIGQTAKKVIK